MRDIIAISLNLKYAWKKEFDVTCHPSYNPNHNHALLSTGEIVLTSQAQYGDGRLTVDGRKIKSDGSVVGSDVYAIASDEVSFRLEEMYPVRRWRNGKRNGGYVHIHAHVAKGVNICPKSVVLAHATVEGATTLTKTLVREGCELSAVTAKNSIIKRRSVVYHTNLIESFIHERCKVTNATLRHSMIFDGVSFDTSEATNSTVSSYSDVDQSTLVSTNVGTHATLYQARLIHTTVKESVHITEATVKDSTLEDYTNVWRTTCTGVSTEEHVMLRESTVTETHFYDNTSVRKSTVKDSDITVGSTILCCDLKNVKKVGGALYHLTMKDVQSTIFDQKDNLEEKTIKGKVLNFTITNIGSRKDTLSVLVTKTEILLSTGCQSFITIKDFRFRMSDDYKRRHAKAYHDYEKALEFIQHRADSWRKETWG